MFTTLLLLIASTSASPLRARVDSPTSVLDLETTETTETTSPTYDWSADWEPTFQIHQSCNSTLRAQLEHALEETVQLSRHARDHLLRFGHHSDFVQKYFGNGSTATPIGWYDRIIAADKTGVIFRCDDPDQNCATQDRKYSF